MPKTRTSTLCRRALPALLACMAAATAHASTEPHPLALRLEGARPDSLQVVVENRTDRAQAALLRAHARGGSLAEALPESAVHIPAGGRLELPLHWRSADDGELRVRAWLPGSSAYVQDRVFRRAGELRSLEQVLATSGAPALTTQPPLLLSQETGVTGQVLYPSYEGEVLPLPRARVRIGSVEARTDEDGRFRLEGVPAGSATLEVELSGARWEVRRRGGGTYGYQTEGFEVPEDGGVSLGEVRLPTEAPVTEAAWIHAIAARAERFLEEVHGDVSWWDSLPIYWPSGGDYYSWGSLHISEAHRWDVIGHELGHAVYFAAGNFSGGGGAHKIDECYSQGLALSEGWATYFSGAIFLERDDPDARFEFLVPRRAPIRLENVPEDVCQGPTNEWRVAAAFWDLFDVHADGEDSLDLDWDGASFTLMRSGARKRGMPEVVDGLVEGLDPDTAALLRRVAAFNTVVPAEPSAEE